MKLLQILPVIALLAAITTTAVLIAPHSNREIDRPLQINATAGYQYSDQSVVSTLACLRNLYTGCRLQDQSAAFVAPKVSW